MDTLYYENPVIVTFEDTFPYPGEEREIILLDKSEWLIQVIEVKNLEWVIENGKVTGAKGRMKYKHLKEVRPSSVGKLRLV